jgi:peptidoglycan/LPS O-acetylase OafA/YrhL
VTRFPRRRQDIQGLRAIAVIAVVGFHAGLPLTGGFLGVDIFFAISGFVITTMLYREWRLTGKIRLGRFYLRRLKRLTPALALVVTVTLVASILFIYPFQAQIAAAQTGAGAMLFIANLVIANTSGGYFDAPAASNPLLNTWSLSVEDQFYLIFPFTLLIVWTLGRRFSSLKLLALVSICILGCLSLLYGWRGQQAADFVAPDVLAAGHPMLVTFIEHLLRFPPIQYDNSWLTGFYSPLTRAWEFAAGGFVALVLTRKKIKKHVTAQIFGFVGLGLLAFSFVAANEHQAEISWINVVSISGVICLLAAGSNQDWASSGPLARRLWTQIGDRSYSIYLWHWPIIVFVSMTWPGKPLLIVCATIFSIFPALASYRWLENPIRRSTRITGIGIILITLICIVIPISVAAVVAAGAANSWGIKSVKESQKSRAISGCVQIDSFSCVVNQAGKGRPIYLFGDSNAEHFAPAIEKAAQFSGSPMTVSTYPGCAFAEVYSRQELCGKFYANAINIAMQEPDGTVFISMTSRPWTGLTKSAPDQYRPMIATLTGGLEKTITTLQGAGQNVVLVKPMFRFEDPGTQVSIDQLPLWQLWGGGHGKSVSRDEINPAQIEISTVYDHLSDKYGIPVVDITPYQCPRNQCNTFFRGIPINADMAHVSRDFSEAMTPLFIHAITDTH